MCKCTNTDEKRTKKMKKGLVPALHHHRLIDDLTPSMRWDGVTDLYEWQKLLLKFVENNADKTDAKTAIAFLPSEYSWKTYGAMNVMFWNRNQSTSLEDAKKNLEKPHAEPLALIEKYSNEDLFTKKHFAWTGGTDLGSYFVSTTSSHYDWALKKLKAHRKNCGK